MSEYMILRLIMAGIIIGVFALLTLTGKWVHTVIHRMHARKEERI